MTIRQIARSVIGNIAHPAISIFALVDLKSKVHPSARVNRLTRFYNSSIDKHSYIGSGSIIEDCDIGSFCSISWDCQIGLRSHSTSHISTSPIFLEASNGTRAKWIQENIALPQTKRTTIGSDVWIGSKATILAGISIGHGAVIGTGSIVTKDIPPYSIAAGNPARIIRKRFEDDLCAELIEMNWWKLEDAELKKLLNIFQTANPSLETIELLKSLKSKIQN